MSGLIPVIALLAAPLLGLAGRRAALRGRHFSQAQLQSFAADLRRELYARCGFFGEWIEIGDYLSQQPYYPGLWCLKVTRILTKQGVIAQFRPGVDAANARVKLTEKALEEARMERMMSAAEQPRNINNVQASVVQIGDHNQAKHVNATFGTDQSALLSQLSAALADVARNAALPPQLRQAADEAATDLRQSEPGRIPAILERLRGMASVAAGGFEAVSPILDALRSVIS